MLSSKLEKSTPRLKNLICILFCHTGMSVHILDHHYCRNVGLFSRPIQLIEFNVQVSTVMQSLNDIEQNKRLLNTIFLIHINHLQNLW